jgi:multidrug efflux pump subunit AcrB
VRLQTQLNEIIATDPAVASFASQVGAGTAGQQSNDGRFYINLKPWDQRPHDGVARVIARLAEKARGIVGVSLFMQPAQDM